MTATESPVSDQPINGGRINWRSALGDFLVAALILLAADLLLFHAGLYFPLVEPDSYTGQRQRLALHYEEFTRGAEAAKDVVFLGNSMVGQGIQERVVTAELAAAGLASRAVNLGQGGSSPRSWYYILKNEEISGETTRLVVLGISPMALATDKNQNIDLNILKASITLNDIPSLVGSLSGLETQLAAVHGLLLKSLLFRHDVRDLVLNPGARRVAWAAERQKRANWSQHGRRNSSAVDLSSARLGPDGRLVQAELSPYLLSEPRLQERIERRFHIVRRVAQRNPRPMKIDPIHRKYLARIVERMNARGTVVAFAMVPGTPLPLPTRDTAAVVEFYETLKADGYKVLLWNDAEELDRLESRKYFLDMLHLNEDGADLYSAALGRFVADYLASTERNMP